MNIIPIDTGALDPWLIANLALAFCSGSYVLVDLTDRLATILAGRDDLNSEDRP